MKHISDECSLSGKLETITVTELRRAPGEVLASVGLGKVYVVTKAGKAVAVISKVPGQTLTMAVSRRGQVSYVL